MNGIWMKAVISLFFICIFLFTANSISDWDTFFHIKSGEVMSHQGILSHDVFSQASPDRKWYPHEWLFQLGLFQYVNLFGEDSLKYFVGFFATLQVVIIYFLVRKVFNLSVIWSFFICLAYTVLCYNLFVPRPQIVAQVFFFTNIFLILLYLYKNKNLLFLSLPIVYVWSNMHLSAVLNNVLFFGYAVLCFFVWVRTKEKEHYKKFVTILLYAFLCLLISLLPKGMLAYEYFWLYLTHHDLFSRIVELQALYNFSNDFFTYSALLLTIITPICFFAYRRRDKTFLWLIPFFFWLAFGFTTIRSVYYGYFALLIFIAWFLSRITFRKLEALQQVLIVVGAFIFLCVSSWMLHVRLKSISPYTPPDELVQFIQKNNLQGNMFNTYEDGNYLLYKLYPHQKVFLDGRADVYLCCELPDYFALKNKVNDPGDDFGPTMNSMFSKYKINYAILPTDTLLGKRMITVLRKDTQWALVFWDNKAEVYIKQDGLNDSVVANYKATAAMPSSQLGYDKTQMDQALNEYLRMDTITESALTKNNIGFIYLKKDDLTNAKKYFEQSLRLDKKFVPAYANLAEVYVKQKQGRTAVSLYETALALDSSRIGYYPRLATLYYALGDKQKAKMVLEAGAHNAPNAKMKEQFQGYLQQLENSPK